MWDNITSSSIFWDEAYMFRKKRKKKEKKKTRMSSGADNVSKKLKQDLLKMSYNAENLLAEN